MGERLTCGRLLFPQVFDKELGQVLEDLVDVVVLLYGCPVKLEFHLGGERGGCEMAGRSSCLCLHLHLCSRWCGCGCGLARDAAGKDVHGRPGPLPRPWSLPRHLQGQSARGQRGRVVGEALRGGTAMERCGKEGTQQRRPLSIREARSPCSGSGPWGWCRTGLRPGYGAEGEWALACGTWARRRGSPRPRPRFRAHLLDPALHIFKRVAVDGAKADDTRLGVCRGSRWGGGGTVRAMRSSKGERRKQEGPCNTVHGVPR